MVWTSCWPSHSDCWISRAPSRWRALERRRRQGIPMTSPIITEAVRALVDRRDLTRIEAAAAMEAVMSGAATDAQIAAFLTAMRMKGESVEELIGFAQVMRQKVVRVRAHGSAVV